jgi:hypothetical protein
MWVANGVQDDGNRSNIFHTIIGHYLGCGWSVEQIIEHLAQYSNGIGSRYIAEQRLAGEVERSAGKYGAKPAAALPLFDAGNQAPSLPAPEDDPELLPDDPPADPQLEDDVQDPEPQAQQPAQPVQPDDEYDPELEDDEELDGEELNETPQEVGMASETLVEKVFEPIVYVVPVYIAEGLTVFAGKPKTGKSWLMLHVAIAVASGGFTLGDIHCAAGDVLYCALEDNKRRLQRRLIKLLNGKPGPKRLRLLSAGEMPMLNDGGLDMIRAWIEQVELPKLVVVNDVCAAALRARSGRFSRVISHHHLQDRAASPAAGSVRYWFFGFRR